MDKWQTIHSFWSSFGIPAYDESSVPDNAVMPYITYSASISSFEKPIPLTASIWYNSTSWEDASKKSEEIERRLSSYAIIGMGDGEYLFLTQGDLFAQRAYSEDDRVKRIYLNVMAEYFSAH